jgi:DNA-binding transcriptional LysR family regulator
MVLQAAEAGHGVALGWSYVTDPLLADGRLVCPVERRLETRDGYYLCTSENAGENPALAAFLDWIGNESLNLGATDITPRNAIHSK